MKEMGKNGLVWISVGVQKGLSFIKDSLHKVKKVKKIYTWLTALHKIGFLSRANEAAFRGCLTCAKFQTSIQSQHRVSRCSHQLFISGQVLVCFKLRTEISVTNTRMPTCMVIALAWDNRHRISCRAIFCTLWQWISPNMLFTFCKSRIRPVRQ